MKSTGRKTVKAGKTSAPMAVKVGAGGATAKASGGKGHEPSHDEIAKRAYELYLSRGSVDGYHEEDWLLAEAELRTT